MLSILTTLAVLLTGLACLLFIIAILLKRNDIADVAWGPGIALTAWTGAYLSPIVLGVPHYLLLTLITIWAARLGLRILIKNATKPEDKRYQVWRESWGAWFYPRSFLQVFLLQCMLMLAMATVAIAASLSPASMFTTEFLFIGGAVWLLGFIFEFVGDWQLDAFLKQAKNKGKLMTTGLWKYSRHPNYFGEITMWWGLWLMTVGTSSMLIALTSPILITLLIVFVSGLPLLEKMMEKHPDWARYKRATSVLIPLPPAEKV